MKKRHFTKKCNNDLFLNVVDSIKTSINVPLMSREITGLIGPAAIPRYLSKIKRSDGADRVLNNILIDHIYSTDKLAPLAGFWSIFMLGELEEKISFNRVSYDDSWNITKNLVVNKRTKNILELLQSTKTMGTVSIKKEPNVTDVVEFKNGFTTRCKPDPRFLQQVKNSSIMLNDVQVLMIEGAPSTVSDINYFLKKCHENKNHAIVLARSFPEEVVATLAVNWNKKSLMVVPLLYGHDVFSINSMKDLQAIVGGQPYSPALGDRLGEIEDSRLGYMSRISITPTKCVFNADKKDLNFLISDLIDRIDSEESAAKIEILNQRLCDFNNDGIQISLKDSKNTLTVFEELHKLISYQSSICKFGIINWNGYKIPKNTFDIAVKSKNSFLRNIKSIGGFLHLVDEDV